MQCSKRVATAFKFDCALPGRRAQQFLLVSLALACTYVPPLRARAAAPPRPAPSVLLPECAAKGAALAARGDLHGASRRALDGEARGRVALAIVTHPPTFALAAAFVAAKVTAGACDWDAFLVFSSSADARAYANDYGVPARCAYAALEFAWPCHSASALVSQHVIISAKKLYSLAVLAACYEVLVPVDAELVLLAPHRVREAALGAAARARVFGASNSGHEDCSIASAEPLSTHARARARNLTRDWALWTWWNELPVFEGADFLAFADAIDFPARVPQQYQEFDHLVYTYWKIARGDWAVIDVTADLDLDGPLGNILDASRLTRLATLHPPGPVWTTAAVCTATPALCTGDGAFVIAHHVDRGVEPWWPSKWAPASPEPEDGAVVEDLYAAADAACPRLRGAPIAWRAPVDAGEVS